MDRRRFIPSTEGLDSRLLLSGTTANLHQKTVRIDRLPFALSSMQAGRVVPSDLVVNLQNDLRGLVGKLQPPPSASLTALQLQFRSTLKNTSISAEDAAALRANFRRILEGAQAPQNVVNSLVANMDRLVQVDSNGRDPARLAANDYALIIQTALGVGRPIRTPAAPSLSPADDNGAKGDRTTTITQPRLVGRYDTAGAVQLLDENSNVLGTAEISANGQYSVAPSTPLVVGKHTLRVRAFDFNGNFSSPSRSITITIRAPKTTSTPGGPLSL